MTEADQQAISCGFLFAVTGARYNDLARRAAQSLRKVHPDAQIDLFTDMQVDDPVFSQVHLLSESWFRPKMEAMARSRFDRSIFLDADIMVVGDLSPVFDVLDRFDIAAAQDRMLNSSASHRRHTQPVPAAFAVLNGGVLAIRRSDATHAFLEHWQSELKESGADRDQPSFRELLYRSDLRLCVLPPGYNFLTFHELRTWWGMFGAPRVLHAPHLHRGGTGDPSQPFTLEEVVGRRNAARIRALIHADIHLTPEAAPGSRRLNNPLESRVLTWARRVFRPILLRLRHR